MSRCVRCRQVYDHDATVALLVWSLGGARNGSLERNIQLGLLVTGAFLLFSPPNLLDDKRGQHGVGPFSTEYALYDATFANYPKNSKASARVKNVCRGGNGPHASGNTSSGRKVAVAIAAGGAIAAES